MSHKPADVLDWNTENDSATGGCDGRDVRGMRPASSNIFVRGGTVLFVATAAGRADTLAAILGVAPWNIEEAAMRPRCDARRNRL